jgi:hypothetical protein
VMTTAPAATAVTIPLEDTVAMLVFEDVQLIVWPVNWFPDESSATAVSGVYCPGVSDAVLGVTRTVETGAGDWLHVADAVAVTDPAVAEICALPAATSRTIPDSETVAIAGLEDTHLTLALESGTPEAVVTAAVNAIDWPGLPEIAAGLSATAATLFPECSVALPDADVGESTAEPWTHPTTNKAASAAIAVRMKPPASVRRLDWHGPRAWVRGL